MTYQTLVKKIIIYWMLTDSEFLLQVAWRKFKSSVLNFYDRRQKDKSSLLKFTFSKTVAISGATKKTTHFLRPLEKEAHGLQG